MANQDPATSSLPVRSPMFDGPGMAKLGSLNRIWNAFFQGLARSIIALANVLGETNVILASVPSGPLALTAGYLAVPDLTVTLGTPGVWRIDLALELNFSADAGGVLAEILVDTVAETRLFRFLSGANFAGVATQFWYVSTTGNNILTVKAKASVAGTLRQVVATNSMLLATFLHP